MAINLTTGALLAVDPVHAVLEGEVVELAPPGMGLKGVRQLYVGAGEVVVVLLKEAQPRVRPRDGVRVPSGHKQVPSIVSRLVAVAISKKFSLVTVLIHS
jgi:hypothetical protein